MTATQFLSWVDKIMEKSLANSDHQPCCKKGCHHCCHEAAYAETREVEHMIGGLTDEQRARVTKRTETWIEQSVEVRKAKPSEATDFIDAFDYLERKIPCPLLEGGLCMVYERRPMSCRTHFAIGNPDDCLMPNRRHQKFALPDYSNPTWGQLFRAWNAPPKTTLLDHIGVHLAQQLLGLTIESSMAHRIEFVEST